ncbi:hypothetical protein C7271_25700 [filamentous cyanobacterium CCP5]|nr:hypothetical protein C7271_25700 [filamentous cyanobacterium CCP5]
MTQGRAVCGRGFFIGGGLVVAEGLQVLLDSPVMDDGTVTGSQPVKTEVGVISNAAAGIPRV